MVGWVTGCPSDPSVPVFFRTDGTLCRRGLAGRETTGTVAVTVWEGVGVTGVAVAGVGAGAAAVGLVAAGAVAVDVGAVVAAPWRRREEG